MAVCRTRAGDFRRSKTTRRPPAVRKKRLRYRQRPGQRTGITCPHHAGLTPSTQPHAPVSDYSVLIPGTKRQFRSSSERHQQRLLLWSLSTKGVQNRLLLCLVPSISHAGMALVPRFDRARNLTPGLPPSSLAVCHEPAWGAPYRFLARPDCGARRCRRTEARKAARRLSRPRDPPSGCAGRGVSAGLATTRSLG
jgi:hypothetical protein